MSLRRIHQATLVVLFIGTTFSLLLGWESTFTMANNVQHSFVPEKGFVPNAETAVRIAEAILMPIYGEEQVRSERPFEAVLKNGVWFVEGSLPQGMKGGVAVVEISQKDARILRVSHGK